MNGHVPTSPGSAESEPPRVVSVVARLNIGGPARYIAALGAGLQRRGYDTLLIHGLPEPAEGSLAHLIADRNLPAWLVPTLLTRVSPWNDLRAFLAVARKLFEVRPDVVHTHTAKAGVLGRLAGVLYNATKPRRHRCLIAHTYHGNVLRGYFGPIHSLLARLVERTMALATDRIAVLSEQQRREIVDEMRIAPAAKVTVVPLGLDLEVLLHIDESSPTLRPELQLSDDALVLGFVGRLVAIKDPDTLLRAFKLVREAVPSAMLLVAGDGALRTATINLASSLEIAGAVRFLGWRLDLPALYHTLDIVVLSSLNEGTPVSVIEGMAAGRAVVATSVGGVPDLIEHGTTGLLVPAGDPRALADAVTSIATAPETRARLGQQARRVVAARHHAARLVDDVDRWYRDGLAGKRRVARDTSS